MIVIAIVSKDPTGSNETQVETNVTLVFIPELVRRTGFDNIRLGTCAYEKWIWRNLFVWYSDLFDVETNVTLVLIPELVRRTGFDNIR